MNLSAQLNRYWLDGETTTTAYGYLIGIYKRTAGREPLLPMLSAGAGGNKEEEVN